MHAHACRRGFSYLSLSLSRARQREAKAAPYPTRAVPSFFSELSSWLDQDCPRFLTPIRVFGVEDPMRAISRACDGVAFPPLARRECKVCINHSKQAGSSLRGAPFSIGLRNCGCIYKHLHADARSWTFFRGFPHLTRERESESSPNLSATQHFSSTTTTTTTTSLASRIIMHQVA
jgi:hypothetical protein